MNERTIIAVFCYKRAAKLKKAMEALLRNPECGNMNIVFFCDGHKGETDMEGVKETRNYINNLKGFRNIYKHFRERNISTGPNFQQGIMWLCANYESFIVIEDDLVVTANYLAYMLESISFYRKYKEIFCITGFCFPVRHNHYEYDTVIANRFCSYGWASWSDRVRDVVWNKEKLKEMIRSSPDFRKRLNQEGLDLYRMLLKQIAGTISTWDIQMQVHVSEHNLKVVYPVVSKGANIGFDHESTNTFGIDYLKTPQDTGVKRKFLFCDPSHYDPSIQKQLKRPYRLKSLATRKIINTVIKLSGKVCKAAASI